MTTNDLPENGRSKTVTGLFDAASVISVILLIGFAYASWTILRNLADQGAKVDEIGKKFEKLDSRVKDTGEQYETLAAETKKKTDEIQKQLEVSKILGEQLKTLEKKIDDMTSRLSEANSYLLESKGFWEILGDSKEKPVDGLKQKIILKHDSKVQIWLRAYPILSKHRCIFVFAVRDNNSNKIEPLLKIEVTENSPPIDLLKLVNVSAGEHVFEVTVKGNESNFSSGTLTLGKETIGNRASLSLTIIPINPTD
ncbi:coiled-coil domain-containing protein [Zavarzinella formosa]|uniref:coiled-coil domain-containing protein n=1 Tax=Zavarzinella formosa TaxID=360055 RepID=UPI0003044425|nr:hypothetical protein [Zavarzinella formosa]